MPQEPQVSAGRNHLLTTGRCGMPLHDGRVVLPGCGLMQVQPRNSVVASSALPSAVWERKLNACALFKTGGYGSLTLLSSLWGFSSTPIIGECNELLMVMPWEMRSCVIVAVLRIFGLQLARGLCPIAAMVLGDARVGVSFLS